jgi:magnesium chelatase family protein
MLASRLPGILPPLDEAAALEVAAIRSVCGMPLDPARWRQRPFRAPHHTASSVALVGGGSSPRPGEISLAHHGVLFLDELPEFERRVLEVLREPLETGHIVISRAARQAQYPARFQLVAAMNPCPCGYLGDTTGRCHCSLDQVARYRRKLSGPLLDRIDMHVEVPRLPLTDLNGPPGDSSDVVRQRVQRARESQQLRTGRVNNRLENTGPGSSCQLQASDLELFRQAMEKLQLSARAFHRILKLARTIADLDGAKCIERRHLTEAISYRVLDRA